MHIWHIHTCIQYGKYCTLLAFDLVIMYTTAMDIANTNILSCSAELLIIIDGIAPYSEVKL